MLLELQKAQLCGAPPTEWVSGEPHWDPLESGSDAQQLAATCLSVCSFLFLCSLVQLPMQCGCLPGCIIWFSGFTSPPLCVAPNVTIYLLFWIHSHSVQCRSCSMIWANLTQTVYTHRQNLNRTTCLTVARYSPNADGCDSVPAWELVVTVLVLEFKSIAPSAQKERKQCQHHNDSDDADHDANCQFMTLQCGLHVRLFIRYGSDRNSHLFTWQHYHWQTVGVVSVCCGWSRTVSGCSVSMLQIVPTGS